MHALGKEQMLFAAHGYYPGKKNYTKIMLLEKNKCYLRHMGTIRGKKNYRKTMLLEKNKCYLRHTGTIREKKIIEK